MQYILSESEYQDLVKAKQAYEALQKHLAEEVERMAVSRTNDIKKEYERKAADWRDKTPMQIGVIDMYKRHIERYNSLPWYKRIFITQV